MADSNNGSLPTISSLASNGSNFSGRDVNDFGTKTLVSLEMNQPKPNNIYTKQSSLDSMTPFNKVIAVAFVAKLLLLSLMILVNFYEIH